jgi:UDPglucose--hexose-1-phosphate uridylyltransferase
MEGAGAHEVVVDTPDHDLSLIEMDEGQIVKVLNTCKERHAHLASDGRYKFILIFKNHGPEAGASLHHSHSQIIAILFVPELMLHELQDCREYRPEGGGSCAYEELVRTEGDLGLRMVIDLEHFSVHCPYASRFPFEVLIAPKKHAPSFVSIDAGEVRSLTRIMRHVLKRYARSLTTQTAISTSTARPATALSTVATTGTCTLRRNLLSSEALRSGAACTSIRCPQNAMP